MPDPIRFITGGTLPPDAPSYQERAADAQLLDLCTAGQFAYVLTSRQMGKSSLMARTAYKLRHEGITPVVVDLTSIGTQKATAEQWYLHLLEKMESACDPETAVDDWWARQQGRPPAARFTRYIADVLLREFDGRLVVFVDEIDSTLGLPFTDDFFAAIRALYNGRATDPTLERLSFVLLGVATPGELIRDPSRTPFNIGHRVELSDFAIEQIRPLAAAAIGSEGEEKAAAERIAYWTGGQPYLTQTVCALLARQSVRTVEDIDRIVVASLLGEKVRGDPHFMFVANYLLASPDAIKRTVFETIEACLRGEAVVCEDASPAHNRLRLSGMLVRVDGVLRLRNELYRRQFGLAWVRAHRPTFWTERNKRRGLQSLTALALVLAVAMGELWREANRSRSDAEASRMQAEANRKLATAELDRRRAAELANRAKSMLEGDGATQWETWQKALRAALAAHRTAPTDISDDALFTVLASAWDKPATVLELADLNADADPASYDFGTLSRLYATREAKRLALSPDGQRIATTHPGGRLVVWDLTQSPPRRTGRVRLPFSDPASALTFMSDSRSVVAATQEEIATVSTETATATPIGSIAYQRLTARQRSTSGRPRAHTDDLVHAGLCSDDPRDEVRTVVPSPDGRHVACTIRTPRLGDRIVIADRSTRRRTVYDSLDTAAAFSATGAWVAMADRDGRLVVRDVQAELRIAFVIVAPDKGEKPAEFVFAGDGRHLVIRYSKRLLLWSLESARLEAQTVNERLISDVTSMSTDTTGGTVLLETKNGVLRWHREGDRALIHELPLPFSDHRQIAVSPDGNTLSMLDASGKVSRWNMRDMHFEDFAVGVTADGTRTLDRADDDRRLLATSAEDVVQFDWGRPSSKRVIAPDEELTIGYLAFMADGRRLLFGSYGKPVRSLDLGDGDRTTEAPEPFLAAPVSFFSSSHGGGVDLFAAWSPDNHIRIYRGGARQGWTSAGSYDLKDQNCSAVSADGRFVAMGSTDGSIALWDVVRRSEVAINRAAHSDELRRLAFSPDGRTLASVGLDRHVRLWDARSLKALAVPASIEHQFPIRSVAFSPDGQRLATGDWGGKLMIWDTTSWRRVGPVIDAHERAIMDLVYSPEGDRLLSGSWDGTVKIWNARAPAEPPKTLNIADQAGVVRLALSRDGRRMAVGSLGGLTVWDVARAHRMAAYLGNGAGNFTTATFADDQGREVLTVGSGGTAIRLHDLKGAKKSGTMATVLGTTDLVAYGPRRRLLALAGGGGHITLWDTTSRQAVGTFLHSNSVKQISALAFNSDGSMLASADSGGGVRLWNVTSRTAIGELVENKGGNIRAMAFSPDGRFLAIGSGDGTLRIRNAPDGTLAGEPIEGNRAEIEWLAFTTDGQRLVTAGADGALRLWSSRTRKPIATVFKRSGIGLWSGVYSRDGRFVQIGDSRGLVRRLPIERGAVVDTLCHKLQAEPTPREWAELVKEPEMNEEHPKMAQMALCPR